MKYILIILKKIKQNKKTSNFCVKEDRFFNKER